MCLCEDCEGFWKNTKKTYGKHSIDLCDECEGPGQNSDADNIVWWLLRLTTSNQGTNFFQCEECEGSGQYNDDDIIVS